MNPEHPPLPKVLAAPPLVLRGVRAAYNHISGTISDEFSPAFVGQGAFGEWLLERWNQASKVQPWARCHGGDAVFPAERVDLRRCMAEARTQKRPGYALLSKFTAGLLFRELRWMNMGFRISPCMCRCRHGEAAVASRGHRA